MGRAHRIDRPGSYYHVGSRGNNRQWIYVAEIDRLIQLELMERVARRHGWVVYAYCQMTNHYHLVLHTPEGGLSDGMQVLNGEFSRRTNRVHGRTGHLVQNRFAYRIIESEQHLFEACRYVHLNPVRAGLCGVPEDWQWSGHRAALGLELPETFFAVGALLRLFGRRLDDARDVYRAFVDAGHGRVSDTPDIAELDVTFWDEFASGSLRVMTG